MADPLGRMMCTSETYRELTKRLMATAAELCNQRIVATHEGGYSNDYVPFCGLSVLEELSGIRSGVADPWLAEYERTSGSELLAHQDAAIRAAEQLIARIPAHNEACSM
jgi:acetoin utilization deacetylase AcuC-like enzyme